METYLTWGLIVCLIILAYASINLLKKNEKFEEIIELQENYILSVNTLTQAFIEKLDEVDPNGVFKSDDEIGYYYRQLSLMKNSFKTYLITRNEKEK